MRILIAILFSCLSCSAQFVVQQPFLLSAQSVSGWDGRLETLGGIYGFWDYRSNVTLNTSISPQVVSNWADTVYGTPFVYASSTKTDSPTNSASLGIFFDGFNYARWLKAVNGSKFGTNWTLVLIGTKTTKNAAMSWFDVASGWQLSSTAATTNFVFTGKGGGGNVRISPDTYGAYSFDLTVTLTGTTNMVAYWNGDLYTNKTWNDTYVTNNQGQDLFIGGSAPSGGSYTIGGYKNIAFYTNTGFGSIEASNVHWFRTNYYGSP